MIQLMANYSILMINELLWLVFFGTKVKAAPWPRDRFSLGLRIFVTINNLIVNQYCIIDSTILLSSYI